MRFVRIITLHLRIFYLGVVIAWLERGKTFECLSFIINFSFPHQEHASAANDFKTELGEKLRPKPSMQEEKKQQNTNRCISWGSEGSLNDRWMWNCGSYNYQLSTWPNSCGGFSKYVERSQQPSSKPPLRVYRLEKMCSLVLSLDLANLWEGLHMLSVGLHASARWLQTFSTQPLTENCSPITSLAHVLAEPTPISFTAAAIELADRQHRHNARNPDITQYPEWVRGDMCCWFTDRPVQSVATQLVCASHSHGRLVKTDENDIFKNQIKICLIEETSRGS